jgi:SH3 domain protein
LRRRVSELTAETEAAAIENSQLGSRSRQNWFVVGAAVLFAGIVIGLIAPTLRRTRRSSW